MIGTASEFSLDLSALAENSRSVHLILDSGDRARTEESQEAKEPTHIFASESHKSFFLETNDWIEDEGEQLKQKSKK